MKKSMFGSVDFYAVVSMNAFNFWHLIFKDPSFFTSDQLKWMNVSYKNWGLIMFCVASFLAMLPLFIGAMQNIFTGKLRNSLKLLSVTFSLIPLVFFFFNTQMHERYAHPAFIFVLVVSVLYRNPLPFLLMCLAYIPNLDVNLHALGLPNYGILLFNPDFIAVVYLGLIILLYYLLYAEFFKLNADKENLTFKAE